MKTALVISITDLARDPRVNRQIRALSTTYRVVAAGTASPGIEGVRFVSCEPAPRTPAAKASEAARLLMGKFERHYWGLAHVLQLQERLRHEHADVVIANDIETLPLALVVAKGAPVILDAHEYSPREHEHLTWRLVRRPYIEYLCSAFLPRAAAMMTVADGIAREYAAQYGVRPVVVQNSPDYHQLQPGAVREDCVRMIHHGAAVPGRRIERMLEVARRIGAPFRLDLMLIPTVPRYLEALQAAAAGDTRIRFLPPVPMHDLIVFANDYDIGLYLLEPSSFNNLHALPNKFFEFIQSRLAIAIGPSPEMSALVRRYGCGIVSEDFSAASLARALQKLDASAITALKQRSHEAAKELCFERGQEILLALVDRAAGQG